MTFANPIDDPDIYEGMSLQTVRERAEKAAIIGALDRQAKLCDVRAELGVSRDLLYRRMQHLQIERPPRPGE